MARICTRLSRSIVLALALVGVFALAGAEVGLAETPEEAVRRIQAGRHTAMPPPATAPASAPGKGMTIENATGHTLYVYFSGPTSRAVVVQDRKSESVELGVGDYDVAAEVPSSTIVPFYGRHTYQSFTHYWLKLYTEMAGRPVKGPSPSARTSEPTARAAAPVSAPSEGGVFRIVKEHPIQLERSELAGTISISVPPGQHLEGELIVTSLVIGGRTLSLVQGEQRIRNLRTEELGRVTVKGIFNASRARQEWQIWLTEGQVDILRRLGTASESGAPAAPEPRASSSPSTSYGEPLRAVRIGGVDRGVLVAAFVRDPAINNVPLAPPTATIYLRDGTEVRVRAFVLPRQPALVVGQDHSPFNTSRFLTSAKDGARFVRNGQHLVADIAEIPLGTAPLFCGSRFRDDGVYLEMLFDLPQRARILDVARVRVLALGPITVPTDAIVQWWPIWNNKVTVENRSGTDALVRLEGPVSNTVMIKAGSSATFNAAQGSYYLVLRRDQDGQQEHFRGGRFSVGGAVRSVTVEVTREVSTWEPISSSEFDREPVCPPALPKE